MTLIDDVICAVDGFHCLERWDVCVQLTSVEIKAEGARKCAHGGDGVRVD
jgi:hypothetical protein